MVIQDLFCPISMTRDTRLRLSLLCAFVCACVIWGEGGGGGLRGTIQTKENKKGKKDTICGPSDDFLCA